MIRPLPPTFDGESSGPGSPAFEVSCDVADCASVMTVQAGTSLDAWYAAVDAGWANRSFEDDRPGRGAQPAESVDLCPHDAEWADRGRGVPLERALS